MLKYRIVTASILLPLFLALLFMLSPLHFGQFTLVMVLLCAWEWSGLMGIKPFLLRLCYPVVVWGFMSLPIFMPSSWVFLIAFGWWLVALTLVVRYAHFNDRWRTGLWWRGVMGLFVLVPTFRALNFIRDQDTFGVGSGIWVLLFLFVLIWGADSGAYFTGKKWGARKLAKAVSPGKSIEGLLGALVTTVLLSFSFMWFAPEAKIPMIFIVLLSVVTTLFSVLGDLFESMLKRNVDLKDSGRLLPGHGGLLDRIDSLTAAAPIFALGYWFLLKMFH